MFGELPRQGTPSGRSLRNWPMSHVAVLENFLEIFQGSDKMGNETHIIREIKNNQKQYNTYNMYGSFEGVSPNNHALFWLVIDHDLFFLALRPLDGRLTLPMYFGLKKVN